MTSSWDDYYSHFTDWDDAHRFNVRVELKYEEQIKSLGYVEYVKVDDFSLSGNKFFPNSIMPKSKSYRKSVNEITLSFEVPYDWSIDTDWEDKALVLLKLRDEWVIDSSVEDK